MLLYFPLQKKRKYIKEKKSFNSYRFSRIYTTGFIWVYGVALAGGCVFVCPRGLWCLSVRVAARGAFCACLTSYRLRGLIPTKLVGYYKRLGALGCVGLFAFVFVSVHGVGGLGVWLTPTPCPIGFSLSAARPCRWLWGVARLLVI